MTMGKLIRLADHIYPWKQLYVHDGEHSTLQVYVNESSGELEIVQLNDDNKAIRTCMSREDAAHLIDVLVQHNGKLIAK